MTTHDSLDDLRTHLLAGDTLLFLQTFEEQRWLNSLQPMSNDLGRNLIVWSVTEGAQGAVTLPETDPLNFLQEVAKFPEQTWVVLKDFHPYLDDPHVVRKLRDLAETIRDEQKSIVILGPKGTVPIELSRVAVRMTLPFPALADLQAELHGVIRELHHAGSELDPTPDQCEKLAKTVLGLTAEEARRAFRYSLQTADEIDDDVYAQLVSEKRQMVQGSDLLEFYDLDEGAREIGGMTALKDWLKQRIDAFSSTARERGIPTPKGVFLLGVQGCGKSLTARVSAQMLHFPLIRLETSALLTSDRGASEKNLRDVLKLVETIAPVVLWIDEIDKAFAGFEDETASDATMSRLVGTFLTWMEEHRSQVFVVATANSVHRLPPELLRRGRFDELFFVDLPNFEERKEILTVHLQKRGWDAARFDLDRLSESLDGFSGAEIEQIVSSALLESYARKKVLSEDDILEQRELTIPLSQTKEDELFALREWARERCRPATPDSRVAQMLESEERHGLLADEGPPEDVKNHWKELADRGQLNAAVIEYVRPRTAVDLLSLQQDLNEYLDVAGEIGLALRSEPNCVIFSGCNKEFADVLAGLIEKRRLYLQPANASMYDVESLPFSLPAQEGLPAEKPKRPVWVPVMLQVSPPSEPDERLSRIAKIKLNKPRRPAGDSQKIPEVS
jgi:ATP-dependent 26S proteasome regulatory subunit